MTDSYFDTRQLETWESARDGVFDPLRKLAADEIRQQVDISAIKKFTFALCKIQSCIRVPFSEYGHVVSNITKTVNIIYHCKLLRENRSHIDPLSAYAMVMSMLAGGETNER